ncbi:MAG TPA: 4-alpha-glucanotransferase [Acidimicrobiales bacterium]|nr:4-alpha-glucanotransferase [Acidimicrobiales bacterium]
MFDPARWGVDEGYWDVSGNRHETPLYTIDKVFEAMGASGAEPPPPRAVTVRLDHPLPPVPRGRVLLEDAGEISVEGPLPHDLPAGYHWFEGEEGESFSLIVSPGRCPLPAAASWGFATQLYAARSRGSWGMGDLADLRRLVSWSSGLGAGLVVVNPLHATAPVLPQQPSPYFAGSRCFLNPLYIAVEQVPGASHVVAIERFGENGRRLNEARIIDRDRVWSLKSEALQAIFAAALERGLPEEFLRFRESRGEVLEQFASYGALSELLGARWTDWPEVYRHPASGAVREFASSTEGSRRVAFHAWLQWLIDVQLGAAARAFRGTSVGLVADLAVGVDVSGADGWLFQDDFASGMSVGAPPDEFNTKGQNWALTPFDPWRLRVGAYRPWIEALRAAMRHSGGIRVDHVMGLFRLFWIPSGSDPSEGAYVRYPHHDMLNILALEAERAGAAVVGEDLGTVEDSVRADLRERDVLSYRVWWFEPEPPEAWPRKALGAVTTHDLPTVAGVFDGSDLEAQRRLGLAPNEESSRKLRQRLLERTGCGERSDLATVIERAYADLSRAPCLLLSVSIEDAVAVPDRPNMPGTIDEWPNWRVALPFSLEEIESQPLPAAIAEHLNRGARPAGT